MPKVLIITGPTATGKTQFALEIARHFSGELISADSRQVYLKADIITGKDIPLGFSKQTSYLCWQGRPLVYYAGDQTRIWLTDVVNLDEPFNVSFWKSCADLIIADISSRSHLPIVVGGTGLYIKSLTQDLSQIHTPHNSVLRRQLSDYSVKDLFNYLKSLNPHKATSLNPSDAANPRRLLRAIEIAISSTSKSYVTYPHLALALTAPLKVLQKRISDRIHSRLASGAEEEARHLIDKYGLDLPGMTACGYKAFTANDPAKAWLIAERQYLRRQITWFAKIPDLLWFDITTPNWQATAEKHIASWYNQDSVEKT